MTHDELLAKIESFNKVTTEGMERRALRAVVELHKPKGNFSDTYVNGEPNNPYCPECIDPDVYPCPTIQAIEKELS